MIFKIHKYKARFNPYMLKPHNKTVWLLKDDISKLCKEYSIIKSKDIYVKIECNELLGQFVMYTKLAELPDTSLYSNMGSGFLWIAEETMPIADITSNHTSTLEVSIVNDIDTISIADSITINLNENDVEKWSDEEFSKAERHFRENIKLTNSLQRFLFHPGTKDAVVAEIINVMPKQESAGSPFRISTDTEISILGKPLNSQQVIDFSKIGGLNKVVDELRRTIQLPMNFPNYFTKFNIKPPKGLLLYGPPGNGKTMIARAVAQSFGASFIEIDLSDALQKFKGVGEHNLDKKFDEAEKKRNAVIFIDEIDSIASIRTTNSEGHEVSLVGKLLSLMDGIKSRHRVFVIGATNRLSSIDPALRRPGRFDKEIEVPQPDYESRLDILCKYINLDEKNVFDSSVNMPFIKELAQSIDGYSGADISALYTEAVMTAINRQLLVDKSGKATMLKSAEEVLVTKDDFIIAQRSMKTTMERHNKSIHD